MSSPRQLGSWLLKGSLGVVLIGGTLAYADAPAAKWYDTIAASGYLQGSYVGNLNDPHNGAGAKVNNTGRQFDTDSNGFSLNTFLLQLAKPVGDSDHYGFTVRLRTGSDAAALPASTAQFAVQEAYVTYVLPALTKLSFIGGRFVTSEGFEGVDTVNNPNFSEGLLFTFPEPISHTGIKANYVFNDKVNATFGIVNGWNLPADNNDAKSLIWQVATTPTKQISWSFQGIYGKELADPTHADRLSLDSVLSYNMDKLSLNGQLNWGDQSNDPATAGSAGTTHWAGAGVWASYATTSMFTETVRFEVLRDQNNANIIGAPAFADGTTNQTAKEITFTHKTMLTSALGTRLEFRHDWSNQAWFTKSDGSNVRNQNTISMDWFVTF